ncbi:cysteine peptidase family C39 domain-containing protein [Pseudoalteromonas sp. PS5]|uniref:cysteine peptidase family C39 domain-containing protein n=1 Tax=Pseudoalteromonas sp. PS5 TaxID=1437473 RepID=UPI000FFECF0D|nr:cysteine peptidase family C39 domain-containing protein [Pseudoalteromonas sp. PS5]RXF05196.1 hypothetical protein D9603_04315 [Pseudoalteromonas sp. PS5]
MNKNFTSNLALGIDALCLVAKLHGKSVDKAQLLHQFQINSDDPIKSDAQMLRASQSIGFKSKFIAFEPNDICNRVLPAICKSKQGGYAILAKVSNSKLLIHGESSIK